MKKLLTVLGALLGAFAASAQMMPDSTVQVCAYWEVGDKYNYQVEQTKYKVLNRTDTTDVELSAEILTLEVVGATDSTYRVRVSADDYQHSDYQRAAWQEEILQQFGNTPYEFETDEFGSFKRVIIDQKDLENAYPALDAVIDRIAAEQGLDENGASALQAMMRALFTPERLIALYEEEITPLLAFHGLRMEQDAKVDYETEVPSLFGDESTIAMKGSFRVDKDLTDDYSVVIHNTMEADEGDMRKYLKAFFGTAAEAMGTDSNIQQEAEAALQDAEMSLVEDSFEEIHLDTGWPLNYDYMRIIRIKGGGEEREQVQTKTVTIILVDEDEEESQQQG